MPEFQQHTYNELGNINLGPGAEQPQQTNGMDLIPLIERQGQQHLASLDKEWSDKYQQLNKLYDWSRHEKYPDEITRLRGRLERDIAGRRQAVQTGMQQTVSKFAMLDHLFPNLPEVANKLKYKAMFGKEIADQMFPGEQDPRAEHQRNLAEQNRLMDRTDTFVIENDKLYQVKTNDEGKYDISLGADRSKPATPEEIQLWVMSSDALSVLEQQEQNILGQMSNMGMPDPSYLQGLYTAQRRKGFWGKLTDIGGAVMKYSGATPQAALIHEGIKKTISTFTPEPNGTFAQKVGQTLPKRRQSRIGTPKVIKQRNKRTGQERISHDGGKTWQTSG